MISVDDKNAFNEIDPATIINLVRDDLLFVLAMFEVDIIFNDSRAGKTSIHNMKTGVSQGDSLGSALFDIAIAPSIHHAHLSDRR